MKKLLIIIILFSCSCSPSWNYADSKKWGEKREENRFCKIGFNQSPIDITAEFEELELDFKYQKLQAEKQHKDYVLRLSFFGRNYLLRGSKKYHLRYLSFNHPSEHLVKGQAHSLEMQIAHKSEDEQWLILSVFLEVGKENENFRKLIGFLTSKDEVEKINLKKIINKKDKVFFYTGSFTTPPCHEGVKWYVMKTPLKISKTQMNKIIKSAIFSATNARNIQEFNIEKY